MLLLILFVSLPFSHASTEDVEPEKRMYEDITHGSAVLIYSTYGTQRPLTLRSDGVVILSSNQEGTRFRVYKDVPKPGGLILGHAFRVTTLDGKVCRVNTETGLVRCATDSVGKTLRIMDKHGMDDGQPLMSGNYVKFRYPGNGIDCQIEEGIWNCNKKAHWRYYGFIIVLDKSIAPDSSYVPPTPGPVPPPRPSVPPTVPATGPASVPPTRPNSVPPPPTGPVPPPTGNPPRPVALGCYSITTKIGTQKGTYSSRVITNRMSRTRCKQVQCANFPYAALLEGKGCYCFTEAQVNAIGLSQISQDQCNVPCSATPNEKCGGRINKIEIVKSGTQFAAANDVEFADANEDENQAVDDQVEDEPKQVGSITINDTFVPGWAVALLVLASLCAVALIVIVVVLVTGKSGQRV